MTLELKMAEKAVEQGETRFSLFVDGFYPQLNMNMELYELIHTKWREYTENNEATDGSKTFKEATNQILNERVSVNCTPEGYFAFKRAMDKIAEYYYLQIHQPQLRLAEIKGKKLEIIKIRTPHEEIEKRIEELERLTLKLLLESEKTYKEAVNVQYEIKKLKDELRIEYD
jgi:hypothetical protein